MRRALIALGLAVASGLAYAYLADPWRWLPGGVAAMIAGVVWFWAPNRRFASLSVEALKAQRDEAYPRAEQLAREALVAAGRARARRAHLICAGHELLCSVLVDQDKLEEAEGTARTLLDLYRKAGLTPQEHRPPERSLAHILLRAGKTDEAEALLRKLQEAFFFREHPLQRGAILSDLAALEAERGRPARAAEWNTRAIHLLETHRASDRELAVLYMNRGSNHSAAGQAGEALADYQKALFLHERAEPESAVTALLLSNAGVAELELGRPREAAKTLRRSVECWQRVATPWDPRLALTCHILAEALVGLNEWEEAAAYAQRSLEVKGGAEHAEYAAFVLTLAGIRERQGRRTEALALVSEAAPAVERQLGPSHAEVVRLRARIERLTGALAA